MTIFLTDHLFLVALLTVVAELPVVMWVFYFGHKRNVSGWVTAATQAAIAVITATVVGPLLNHGWALTRDRENRKAARQVSHLNNLKPVLESDAREFAALAQSVAEAGRVMGVRSDKLSEDEELIWRRHVLVTDLGNHFPDYFQTREALRRRVAENDRDARNVVISVEQEPGIQSLNQGPRDDVALAVLWKCVGLGSGVQLTRQGSDYAYRNGRGGGQGGSGNPPPDFVTAARTFARHRLDAASLSTCSRLSTQRPVLAAEFRRLAATASVLAQRTTLPGECDFVREVADQQASGR